jgi:ketosteroid isomerase-like protein
MRRTAFLLVFSLAAATLATLAANPTLVADTGADRAEPALLQADIEFGQASVVQGLPAWIERFAEDAVVFPAGGPLLRGKTEIVERWKKDAFDPQGLAWSPAGAQASGGGDFGFTYGVWEKTGKGPDGKLTVMKGKYLTVWRKNADGKWQVVADIGNADPPPPAPAAKKP